MCDEPNIEQRVTLVLVIDDFRNWIVFRETRLVKPSTRRLKHQLDTDELVTCLG
jgi:hypothetical protein